MAAQVPYSALRDPKRPSLDRLLPLDHPIAVFLEPSNVCNFKCRFCPESFSDYTETVGGHAKMDFPLYEKIIGELKAMGRMKVLRFYMLGEPLLHPQLPQMVKLAHDEDVTDRTELTTNATALTAKKSQELIDAGLDYLRVSIYAVDQARNEHVTQSKVSVDKIFENVSGFRKLRDSLGVDKPILYVKMIDSCSEAENARFLELYTPIADECVLEKPMNWNGSGERDLLATVYDTDAEKKTLETKDLFPFQKKICPFPFYTMVINANGDITMCCVDWNKKTIIGNLHQEPLADIWNGDAARAFRRMHIEGRRHENESCRNCTYLFTTPDTLDGLSPERYEQLLA